MKRAAEREAEALIVRHEHLEGWMIDERKKIVHASDIIELDRFGDWYTRSSIRRAIKVSEAIR